jgi:drug/metabolite transporter (DMT)-like permease
MTLAALALILVAAVAHASWNLLSKQAASVGAACFVWLLAVAAACIYAPVVAITALLGHPHLSALNWVFLAGTGVLQSGYFLFLQFGYRLGDLSLVYPIGRGTGALLAALAGVFILGERPGPVALAGIGCIIVGIIAIGLPSRDPGHGTAAAVLAEPPSAAVLAEPPSAAVLAEPPSAAVLAEPPSAAVLAEPHTASGPAEPPMTAMPTAPPTVAVPTASHATARAIMFALCTGAFIACYTIWDKYAVSTLRTPPMLQGCATFPVMLVVFGPLALRDTGRLGRLWRDYRRQIIGAAILAPLAYVLVLTALSFSPVSSIAPAREVSILFGVLLGRRLLGEGGMARRLAAAAAIVVGIVAVAFG